jgi:hypothetical protein
MEPNLFAGYPAQFVRGIHVARATDTLPQTGTDNLFTVSGGRVLINFLMGTVTTIIQNSDPVAKITVTPTTGSAVDVASTVDLTWLEAGGNVVCEGDTTALVKGNAGQCIVPATGFVVPAGTIDLTTGASKTGAIKWDLFYIPIDEGATVVAA